MTLTNSISRYRKNERGFESFVSIGWRKKICRNFFLLTFSTRFFNDISKKIWTWFYNVLSTWQYLYLWLKIEKRRHHISVLNIAQFAKLKNFWMCFRINNNKFAFLNCLLKAFFSYISKLFFIKPKTCHTCKNFSKSTLAKDADLSLHWT